MQLYRKSNIEYLFRAVLDDQFDDQLQNVDLYGGKVFEEDKFLMMANTCLPKGKVLEVGCGSGALFGKLPISHGIEPHPKRLQRCKECLKKVKLKQGVIECIPHRSNYFEGVLAHGLWTWVRSENEALMEVNRVLKVNGVFIFDYISKTNMPLSRESNPQNLIMKLEAFGFQVIGHMPCRTYPITDSVIAVRKVMNFNYKYLLVPQVRGDILNYRHERDWYLK